MSQFSLCDIIEPGSAFHHAVVTLRLAAMLVLAATASCDGNDLLDYPALANRPRFRHVRTLQHGAITDTAGSMLTCIPCLQHLRHSVHYDKMVRIQLRPINSDKQSGLDNDRRWRNAQLAKSAYFQNRRSPRHAQTPINDGGMPAAKSWIWHFYQYLMRFSHCHLNQARLVITITILVTA